MASPLAAVERFFERLFERPAARLFQPRIEVVQIQRALERVMENGRRVQARRTYVPSSFRVLLSDADARAIDGDVRVLARDLAESLRVYARTHGYVLVSQPRVDIGSSASVPPSDVRAYAEPVIPPPPVQSIAPPPSGAPGEGHIDVKATAVFAAHRVSAPSAQLAVRAPNQPVARLAVRSGTIRLGRALDNDVVLADDKVSRHHGQISSRLGMLVYTDLGSTNGSYLNGSPVSEIALGPGDVLQLGSSTVAVEPSP